MTLPHSSDFSAWGAQEISALRAQATPQLQQVAADPGTVVEDRESGLVGAVLNTYPGPGMTLVRLEDRHGRTWEQPLGFGFLIDGQPVELVAPQAAASRPTPLRTASGSIAVENQPARTARASRIWVEGLHDAELVEKVWGDDLRGEAIVVEPLHGADDLAAAVAAFQPEPHRRLGVLLDHLVSGSKESFIAADVADLPGAAGNVLVVGHPYIDIWQAVKPARVGLEKWPHVPRGTDIKVGTLRALGWPANSQADIAAGWKRILAQVRSYTDLEAALLGRVEELIDFVSAV